jgi:phosphoribosylformylglycinamidine cyclo-ligase
LLRKWLKDKPVPVEVISKLMTPTKIYHEIPQIIDMLPEGAIHALAHITGGGISGNLPRGMPGNVTCVIEKNKIPTPNWMKEFVSANGKSFEDLETTFNWGVGMVAVVSSDADGKLMEAAAKLGLTAYGLGWVEAHDGDTKPQVRYQ